MKKVAIITGASSGMGKEFALQINRAMKNIDEIWLIARRKERLDEIREEINKPSIVINEDISKDAFEYKFKKMISQEKPNVRILVNCAGFGLIGPMSTHSMELSVDMINTNCSALTKMIFMTLPYMQEGSRIINLASSAAFLPQQNFAIYAATKSYVLSLSRALNQELKAQKISVTAVCPGPVNTEFFRIAEDGNNVKKAWYKEYFMASADEVVRQALEDARKRNEVSVYGTSMKLLMIVSKIVPHSAILRIINLL